MAESFAYPFEIYPDDWFQSLKLESFFDIPNQPLELDLGCGDGSFLIRMATEYPDRNFVGVERLLGRVRKVSRKAQAAGIDNVRVLRIDSRYAVERLLPDQVFNRIHFLCPDPWPKKKHARRRQMCQMPFLRELHRLLKDDGELLFKTDSAEYFEEALEVQETCPFFFEENWPKDAFFYPTTDFEEQWLAEGRTMNRLRLKKGEL